MDRFASWIEIGNGERILLRYKSNADTKNGVQEFAVGNYDQALKFFEKAIQGDRHESWFSEIFFYNKF